MLTEKEKDSKPTRKTLPRRRDFSSSHKNIDANKQEGCSVEVKDMVLLQLAYFDDKEDDILHYVEETSLAVELQMDLTTDFMHKCL